MQQHFDPSTSYNTRGLVCAPRLAGAGAGARTRLFIELLSNRNQSPTKGWVSRMCQRESTRKGKGEFEVKELYAELQNVRSFVLDTFGIVSVVVASVNSRVDRTPSGTPSIQ
ncbi:hypothetical protein KQX54_021564 [Cotesia glomerata]|uniref:Uncharacterized protein n=1 Tax=Cotesia glomerata TaxID=32391 RepID=A0AAV7J9U4_COTGL|nr:hypothetical protein KQX54_021564 [Cotesia glomerata]